MEEIFITRQAIHNTHNEIVGYELLYHDGNVGTEPPHSDAVLSARLIVNTFMGFGLENLVGSNKAFLNLSHDFFSGEHPIPMASYQLVLEIPGACLEDERVYQELKQLSRRGYTLSLYDYNYDEANVERLDCIDIVKLDITKLDAQALKEQSRFYRNHGKRLQVRGVENDAQKLLCSQLGVDYFQGDLFAAAEHLCTQDTPCNTEVLHAIAGYTQQPLGDIEALQQLISRDAVFCYKLLRYLNCASFSGRSEIHALSQVVLLIGVETLRQWAVILLLAYPRVTQHNPLLFRSLIRANMCLQLAKENDAATEAAFLVGLLSILDKTMERPLEELFDSLALHPDITFALLFGEGELGRLLERVKLRENKEWHSLDIAYSPIISDYDEGRKLAMQWASGLDG